MMAGESKSEVQEVVISEDENSRDGNRDIFRTQLDKRRKLPSINVPEKIFLCLDVTPSCPKMAWTPDREIEPLVALKQALIVFVNNKLSWSPKTEMAIIVLNHMNVCLLLKFTNDKKKLIDTIKRINTRYVSEDMEADLEMPYGLDELFKMVAKNVELPVAEVDNFNYLPPYIVRCILFYGRAKNLSYSMSEESFRYLFHSRFFIFDSVFLHDAEMDAIVQKEIITALADLDGGYSYILESDNNVINFLNKFAWLAAHPLQRPHQNELNNEVAYYRKLLLS